MSEKKTVRPVALAVGAALASTFAFGATASADTGASPFAMTSLGSGYMLGLAEGSCGGDKEKDHDKEGEGSCGEGKDKEGEGSCGEGSCGEDKDKEGEGSCGEGSCGGEKEGEGSCGEGSCGGDKEEGQGGSA